MENSFGIQGVVFIILCCILYGVIYVIFICQNKIGLFFNGLQQRVLCILKMLLFHIKDI